MAECEGPIPNDFTNVSLFFQWKHSEIKAASRELYEAAKAAVGA